MITPSPNEFERLKNEEFLKRRILRLKEVREHSKVNASRLRYLYKEQKTKVINKIAENIQEQINSEDSKTILDLKSKYERQCGAFGDAHNNASDWIDPIISMRENAESNQILAQERHEVAVNQLKIEKEERDYFKNARLDSLNMALAIEKERAIAVALLPPTIDPFYNKDLLKDFEDITPRVRVCDRNKFSVIESYENGTYNVQRLTEECQLFQYGTSNAIEAGEVRQQHLSKIDTNIQMESEEQSIKAQLRGHQAIKKQIVQKDYGELLTNLEHISKSEMAKRQRDYHKNELVNPNSAGYLGIGHTAAMVGYKERCRERAVESAVMESLKDITNKTSSSQQYHVVDETETKGETKLSKLYDIIRKQKENVSFEKKECRDTQIAENNVDNVEKERAECLSPINVRKTNDEPVANVPFSNDVLQNAAAAAIKSSSVLEKSNNQKERNLIEKKIQNLDRRLDMIKEAETDRGDLSSRDSDRSLVSEPCRYDRPPTRNRSEDLNTARSSESVCSDSLNIIREFQRQALMKLSGHPSAQYSSNQLYALQSQFSDLSVRSSTSFDQSRINRLIDGSNTTLEASESHSSVNEWVKTQLIQTVDRIPDWVTKAGTEPQFLPDLNMSFMSSILNIRSETGSTKDDSLSSCSTVLTHSSVLRHTERSSITEVSKIGSTTDARDRRVPYKEFDTDSVDEESESIINLSSEFTQSISSVKLKETMFSKNELNEANFIGGRNVSAYEQNKNAVLEITEERDSISIPCADLINFQSVENLVAQEDGSSDEERSYRIALNELINIADTSNYGLMADNQYSESNSSPTVDQRQFSPLSNRYDLVDLDLNSFTSNKDIPSLHTVIDNNKLISDYESFLSGLVNKPMISPSITCNDLTSNVVVDNNRAQSSESPTSLSSNVPTVKEESDQMASRSSRSVINQEHHDINEDQRSTSNNHNQISYFTSTTREGPSDPLMTISCSPIQDVCTTHDQISIDGTQTLFGSSELRAPEVRSQSSIEQLSPYESDTSETVISAMRIIPANDSDSNTTEYEDHEEHRKKKMKQLLSSTMKPNRCNIETLSPDVSSISSISVEACNRLKQRIMMEYFEKHKNLFATELSGTTNSDLSMKPLESIDDSTPRNPDSGKPSSRLTAEHSNQNTARLSNDDYFMTPRSDNNWTEYTPRSECSTSHTNFRALSDYVSSANQVDGTRDDTMDKVDLDETLKNDNDEPIIVGSYISLNLIDFDSNEDFNGKEVLFNEDRLGSQSLSENYDLHSDSQRIDEDNVPSKESSSACISSSFRVLDSYHSSPLTPTNILNQNEIHEFEDSLPCYIQSLSDNSVDSRSDADTSSISLASFLKNESMCQQSQIEVNTPKRVLAPNRSIDNSEEMKTQLAQWKKQRLSKINQHPLNTGASKGPFVTKTENIRKHDEIEKKSRTLRLYNNLEEVQKLKQKKQNDQRKTENQLKMKEYAEKLRRLKKEKNENPKH